MPYCMRCKRDAYKKWSNQVFNDQRKNIGRGYDVLAKARNNTRIHLRNSVKWTRSPLITLRNKTTRTRRAIILARTVEQYSFCGYFSSRFPTNRLLYFATFSAKGMRRAATSTRTSLLPLHCNTARFVHPVRFARFKMSSEPATTSTTVRQPPWKQPEGQGKVFVYNSLTRSKVCPSSDLSGFWRYLDKIIRFP